MSGAHWSFEDIRRAQRMEKAGLSRREIASAMGRTKGSVDGILRRKLADVRDEDKSMRSMRIDATNGSAGLLMEIQRVFG